MYGLLNGSRVLVQPNNAIETGAYWGFGMGRLFDATGLAQATCEKTFQVYDSSNADEYNYRPGWSQADNLATPRYCVNKVHSGAVSTWYNIRLVSQPNYDLIDPDTGKRKIFDKPIELDFTVPSTAAYPVSEHGKKLKLNYFFPLRFNSFKIFLRSLVGFAPSLSIQILISSIFEVFCACLKSGALVNKITLPFWSNTSV